MKENKGGQVHSATVPDRADSLAQHSGWRFVICSFTIGHLCVLWGLNITFFHKMLEVAARANRHAVHRSVLWDACCIERTAMPVGHGKILTHYFCEYFCFK